MTIRRRLRKGAERFDKSVRTIEQDPQTGLITLTIDWWTQVAALWANQIVSEVNQAASEGGRAIAPQRQYLTEQLIRRAPELRTALFGAMEGEMKKEMLANVAAGMPSIDPAVARNGRSGPIASCSRLRIRLRSDHRLSAPSRRFVPDRVTGLRDAVRPSMRATFQGEHVQRPEPQRRRREPRRV